MRVWQSYDDAERTARTVAVSVEQTGKVPAPLLRAVKDQLATSSKGHVIRFYEVLGSLCPEAMKHLDDAPAVAAVA